MHVLFVCIFACMAVSHSVCFVLLIRIMHGLFVCTFVCMAVSLCVSLYVYLFVCLCYKAGVSTIVNPLHKKIKYHNIRTWIDLDNKICTVG